MITFLRGKLVEKQPTRLVVDVNGIGYELLIPLSSYDRLPSRDEDCHILTFDYVREDLHVLFGFMTEGEREMFRLLVGVSGIGPKIALSALSGLTVQELTRAIAGGNVRRLSSISGLGKKTSERLVVELRDKLGGADMLASADTRMDNNHLRDAILALVSLGYKEAQANKMATGVINSNKGEDLALEEILRQALAR